MAATATIPATIADRIKSTPGLCGGRPCIAGTRIRVLDIYVMHELEGRTADEIVTAYPTITLADVYAALAYYFDHRQEIEDDYKAADAFIAAMRKKHGPGPLEASRMNPES